MGRAEDAPLDPPYALITAGDSLHWMDLDVLLPRLAEALSPNGRLALLTVNGRVDTPDEGFHQGLVETIRRYSTYSEWRPDFDLVAELERRGLFHEEGRKKFDAPPLRQSVDEYVESFHARASLSWDRMDPAALAAFDADLRQLVLIRVGEVVTLTVQARVIWGKPLRG